MLNISDLLNPWRGAPYLHASFSTPITFVDGVVKSVAFETIDAQNGKLGELKDPATFGPGYCIALKRGGVYLVHVELALAPDAPITLATSGLALAITGGGTGVGSGVPITQNFANGVIHGVLPPKGTAFNPAGFGGVSVDLTAVGTGGDINSGKILIIQIAPGLD